MNEQKLINQMIQEGNAYTYVEYMRKENFKSSLAAKAAFEHAIFRPSVIYKYATNDIRDAIINELNKEELDKTVNVNNLLMALAQIGDDVVFKAFLKWEEQPPKWREKLYVGPARYALEGGWCIENGKKKMLTYNKCYSLLKTDNLMEADIVMGGVSKQKCPYCESSYSNLLVLDGKDERLSDFGIKGKIKIKYCGSCVPYEPFTFSKYEVDGEGEVIHRTEGEDYYVEDEYLNELSYFKISKEPVSDIYCNEFERSAIGGFPAFINDAEYADCPICNKKMKHFAQLSDKDSGAGGTIYVQICTDCQTAAVLYQQT